MNFPDIQLSLSESLLLLTGMFILASAGVIAATGDVVLWTTAKITYALGLVLIAFDI